ncbi:LysR substrate-binding domain-containing protein [Amycolatopsis sp. cmx-11-32]
MPSLNVRPLVRERLRAVAPPSDGAARETRAAREAGAHVEGTVQTNSMALRKRLVLGGHGWTILPGIGIAADADGVLSATPLGEPEIWRTVDAVGRALGQQTVNEGEWPSARLREDRTGEG